MHRWWVLVLAFGCADDSEAELESSIIGPTPVVGDRVLLPSAYPALAAHGRLQEAPFWERDPTASHQARFTDGVNLAAAPLVDPVSTTGKRTAWVEALRTVPNARFLQAPAFATHLSEALTDANTKLEDISSDSLDDAANLLRAIGFTATMRDREQHFSAWTPPRARWLDSQWQVTRHPAPAYPETHYLYPTPSGLAATPQRGARLYCAAREMARNQTSGSLGEQVLLPLSILGQPIDIGVFEAFAFVDQPTKFTGGGATDGAQAFNVPLSFGMKVTPIRPFTPALPELRYPFVLTTGDSELVTDVGADLIYETKRCNAFFCVPVIQPDFRYRYKSIAHADTAVSSSQAMDATASIPLFWAGPLLVQLKLDASLGLGRAAPLATVPPTGRPFAHDHLLDLISPPIPWPTPLRGGNASREYLDGPWRLNTAYVPADPLPHVFNLLSVNDGVESFAGAVELAPTTALHASVVADDDHHVAPASELTIGGGLLGTVQLNISLASIKVEAEGRVFGTLGLAHEVRDGVLATTTATGTTPMSGVTITPTGYGSANVQVRVTFELHIKLLFGSIDVSYDLINEIAPIAAFESPWSEEHRLRIGTESIGGDPTQQPDVLSHHGAEALFASFPAGQSVDQCLVDPRPSPPPPPRCGSTPATGITPRVNSCIYMPMPNENECLHIPVVTPESDPALQCQAAKLTYMCSPVSKLQHYGSGQVLAHLMSLDSANLNDLPELRDLVTTCASADPTIVPTDAGVTAWFKTQFAITSCDAAATLYEPGEVVSVGGPSAVTAGSCP
ncbi:MAG: hypothetical protein ABI867_08580 [Kofleriaceae bacterium]